MTGIASTLTTSQIATAVQQANAIATADTSPAAPGTFVFFAAFDGTNNSLDPDLAGNTQATAVA